MRVLRPSACVSRARASEIDHLDDAGPTCCWRFLSVRRSLPLKILNGEISRLKEENYTIETHCTAALSSNETVKLLNSIKPYLTAFGILRGKLGGARPSRFSLPQLSHLIHIIYGPSIGIGDSHFNSTVPRTDYKGYSGLVRLLANGLRGAPAFQRTSSRSYPSLQCLDGFAVGSELHP
jgi:hypothetical protein